MAQKGRTNCLSRYQKTVAILWSLQIQLPDLQGVGTEKDLEHAEAYFNKAAILGNVDAVYGMGMLYLESDPQKAIRYLKLATKQGHTYVEY